MSIIEHNDRALSALVDEQEPLQRTWKSAATELADHALRHLSNRDDAMGAYGANGPFCHKIAADEPEAKKNELLLRLKSHFRGQTIGGLYPNSAPNESGRWYARFGCIDIDLKPDHPKQEWRRQRNHDYALLLLGKLESSDIPALLEDSNGRGGFHIWFRLTDRVEVPRLYAFLQSLVSDAQTNGFESSFHRVTSDGKLRFLPDGKPDLGSDLPETFPKQAETSGKGLGNFIRLPGKHHTYNHWSRCWGDGEWLTEAESVEAWLTLPAAAADLIPDRPAKTPEAGFITRARTSVHFQSHETIGELAERTMESERWCDLLQAAGWKLHSENGAESTWTRPGKANGVSAVLNYQGSNLLTVFTTAVSGLNTSGKQSESYGKWRFYCWTNGFENRQVEAAKAYLPVNVIEEHDRKSREAFNATRPTVGHNSEPVTQEQKEPSRTFGGKTAAELWEFADEAVEWLVDQIFSADQPTIFGAKQKSLKTTLLTDLAVSLSSGFPWLGRFEIPRRRRVLFITGEASEKAAIRKVRRAAESRNLRREDFTDSLRIEALTFPTLPRLEDCQAIQTAVEEHGIEVVLLDPLYMGLSGLNTANLTEVGPAMRQFMAHCRPANVIIAHHVKKSASYDDAPNLEDLSQAGISEFAGNYWLMGRMSEYTGDGMHELAIRYGGRDEQFGLLKLDFDERNWTSGFSSLMDHREDLKQRRENERVGAQMQAIKGHLSRHGGHATLAALAEAAATKPNRDSFQRLIDELCESGQYERATIKAGNRKMCEALQVKGQNTKDSVL